MTPIDWAARTYVAARQHADDDRSRRGVETCRCGAEYTPTPDGRRQHRTLHLHTPLPAREEDR